MKQNNNRIYALDVARGFTVLFIPVIHCCMMFGNEQTYQSSFGSVLAFIAEWPGAQLFMLHMGIGFSIKQSVSFKKLFNRTLILLAIAYTLNILKFVLPYSVNFLPNQLVSDIEAVDIISLLLIGDILHFAAVALPVLFVVKKLPQYGICTIILLFIFCFASPGAWAADINGFSNPFLHHFTDLFKGAPPQAFFPFFPWIVYPLAGISIGYFLQKDGNIFFLPLLITGIVLMIPGLFSETQADETFYRATPWKTLQHLGFICCWLPLWYVLSALFRNSRLLYFLNICGKNITFIYIIQWPVICWLLPVIGYKTNDIVPTISYAFSITVITISIANWIASKRKHLNSG